jgi:hypothetical protein
VAADQDDVRPAPRQHPDDVRHPKPAMRRVRIEAEHTGLDSGAPELRDDVVAGALAARGAGGPWTDRHEPLDVPQRRDPVESRRGGRRDRQDERERDQRQRERTSAAHRAARRAFRDRLRAGRRPPGFTPTAP